ncbi:ester cyclase [Blastopirellula sp. JC732]|uniref:Ester cyclase n=1 Tax=Blastopirellula sediminis TaxID=2894196 RepID=A0A9X1SK10_9BACT|nr:ester cyclase [Blastopirellula sediminis]MCC9607458.1 ester cyclase [Blastopirellula sediminis]MCC9629249.1 ester cyclase [Blastopirellula sediminis]
MEQVKALARRWFEEVWNQRRDEAIQELAAHDAIAHLESGVVINGAEVFKSFRDNLLAALPDMKVEVEAVIADGDAAVVRWNFVGSHKGEGFGFKPTGRTIQARGLTWFRFEDGKIVEGWDSWNQSATFQRMIGDDPASDSAFRAI